ncbi:hypothetical protein K461DRAFT_295707 [Myriangium duriaei CBS 260.36]|uniref:Uncharacterized protein n=1 Tax=Myriangium duriaei CBS 260.36 TaxID=1168546 RepID=A0A9P4J0Z8_9PEZI|nr:hypothetical protein K461DRAFT_295707 [Myriangium duriaei CBS 260.36]
MASSTSVTTYNLVGLSPNPRYRASVVDANPTATTLILEYASVITMTITIGEWAQITPAPSAAGSGVWDKLETTVLQGTAPYTWTSTTSSSEHCMISGTAAVLCTFSGNQPAEWSHTIFVSTMFRSEDYTMKPIPITITAGLEKLATLTNPSEIQTDSVTGVSAIGTAALTSFKGPHNVVNSAIITSNPSNFAVESRAINIGTIGLFGLLALLFVR